ncbi:hypothetical protein M407DRAFT_212107, partial [Tulasnella calospora MUT 4182]
MPTGTPYNGHIPPYNNIRIDSFSTPTSSGAVDYKSPDLLLLTHTHSDHVQGLASKSFGLPLHCSADARTMLLRHESLQERKKNTEPGTHGNRAYAHLESNIVTGNGKTRFTRKLLESAVEGLVKLMTRYPSHYKFFINSWTWGYEEALIGVATCFGAKIHVDRYKYDVYTSLSEPIWKEILTMDPTATRFHACERFDRCSEVDEDETEDVVYVNPNDMGLAGWHAYQQRALEEMSRGNFPSALRFGLCRHSSLPELKALVGLFRPNRVVPNTVYPNMRGADWANIPHLFRDELPPGAGDRIWEEMR